MAHAINSKQARKFANSEKAISQNSGTTFLGLNSKKLEFNRFGISAIVLLTIVCFSGVTVG